MLCSLLFDQDGFLNRFTLRCTKPHEINTRRHILSIAIFAVPDNLMSCYVRLVDQGYVGADEIPLVQAWLEDISSCVSPPGPNQEGDAEGYDHA